MTTRLQNTATTRATWQIDPAHALVEFSGKHMIVSTVKGHFKNVTGTIDFDEANPERSSVAVEIDATSLYSGEDRRDTHLKSPDFLEVDNYPTIAFQSRRVESLSGDRARIIGDLTIRGISHEVVLDAELVGRNAFPAPYNRDVIGFEARTSINRKDWGLNWNMALEFGGLLVSDTIKIEIHAEAFKPR